MAAIKLVLCFVLYLRVRSHTFADSFTPECPECINIPLMLSGYDSQNLMSNIIYHPELPALKFAEGLCQNIQGGPDCPKSVLQSIQHDDWIAAFNNARELETEFKMSRHETLSIIKRIRRYPAPRRLLVLGGGLADINVWDKVNGKDTGGYTCFVNRTFYPESVSINIDQPFVRVIYDIEALLGTFQRTAIDDVELSLETPANYSTLPWDVVLLYDICESFQDDKQRIFYTHDCEAQSSPDCIQRRKCSQLYLDYATQLVSDSGYVFMYIHVNSSIFASDFDSLENKFLYRHRISPHIVDKSGGLEDAALFFYTSRVRCSDFRTLL